MHRPRPNARPGTALAVAGLLPALAAVLSGTVSVTRCVAVPGELAQVGLRLALLRPTAECPTSGVALGGESQQVLAVVVMLTLPMLVLHAALVAGGWGGCAALRRSLARLARLVPWRRLPVVRVVAVRGRLQSAVVLTRRPGPAAPHGVPLLRGPPVPVPA